MRDEGIYLWFKDSELSLVEQAAETTHHIVF